MPGRRSRRATHVDLNSIRKIFTATAIAQWVSQGKIANIDDPINRYLTLFKLRRLPPARRALAGCICVSFFVSSMLMVLVLLYVQLMSFAPIT